MFNATASATDVPPAAGSVFKYFDDMRSQMLTGSQVSRLQKAAKLANLLANDSHVPFHKHPEVVAGAHSPVVRSAA
jgi:hypothetical protein